MESKQQYSLECARFMGLLTYGDYVTTGDNFVCLTDGSLIIDSNRYRPSAGQHLNDVIARANINLTKDLLCEQDKDRDLAAIKCICGFLGVDYEQNFVAMETALL